jgi:hypothetical protein
VINDLYAGARAWLPKPGFIRTTVDTGSYDRASPRRSVNLAELAVRLCRFAVSKTDPGELIQAKGLRRTLTRRRIRSTSLPEDFGKCRRSTR